MLHIKLPKGKTAEALARLADRYTQMDEAEMSGYEALLEAWRKDKKTGHGPAFPLPRPPIRDFQSRARKLYIQAGACSASTGDVYLSATLWDEIKGDYDA